MNFHVRERLESKTLLGIVSFPLELLNIRCNHGIEGLTHIQILDSLSNLLEELIPGPASPHHIVQLNAMNVQTVPVHDK